MLVVFIEFKVLDVEIKFMVDMGVLLDRVVVECVGLGFVGCNGFVINFKLGIWIYFGEMLVSIFFEFDDLLLDSCGDCIICVDCCLISVLVGNG